MEKKQQAAPQPAAGQTKNTSTGEEEKKPVIKTYSIQQITALCLLILLISALLNTETLYTWGQRMGMGRVRAFVLMVIEPLHFFCRENNLTYPSRFLKKSFRTAAGIKTEAGWLAARVDPQTGKEKPPIVTPEPHITPEPKKTPRILYTEDKPLGVLLLGDSMVAEALSSSFGRTVKNNPFVVYEKKARYSSGLSRPDYYNWPAQVYEIYSKKSYDLVVVMLGMNDAQDFEHNNKVYNYGTEEWFTMYRSRVKAFAAQILDKARKLYWLGPPPMRLNRYNKRMMKLNEIYKSVCDENPGSVYISTADILGNEQKVYSDYLKIKDKLLKVRTSDGKHFTLAGAGLVVNKVMLHVQSDFEFLSLKLDPQGLTFQRNAPPPGKWPLKALDESPGDHTETAASRENGEDTEEPVPAG